MAQVPVAQDPGQVAQEAVGRLSRSELLTGTSILTPWPSSWPSGPQGLVYSCQQFRCPPSWASSGLARDRDREMEMERYGDREPERDRDRASQR